MKRTTMRVLSVLLSLLLVMSLAPLSVLAEENDYVAMVGSTGYETLQGALDAVRGTSATIELVAGVTIDEDVIVHQDTNNVDLVIKGNGVDTVFTGHIEIYGYAHHDWADTVTIDGVVFETDEADHVFIEQNTTDPTKRYAHNVTIQNCTFTAIGEGLNTAQAIRFRQCFNIKMENCSADGLHSLLWSTGGQNFAVEKVTVENCKGGASFGTTKGITVSDSTIKTTGDDGYGLRFDGSVATTVTVDSCEVEAFVPVLVRKTSNADYELVVTGDNNMTATNESGYWCVVTGDDYNKDTTDITEGSVDIKMTVTDESLDVMDTFGYAVFGLSGEGTKESPYLIKNIVELRWFRDDVNAGNNYLGKYVKLVDDIDLNDEDWTPIADMSVDKSSFKGIFDGDNHTISNLWISEADKGLAFFGRTSSFIEGEGYTEIKNLKFHNVTVVSTITYGHGGSYVAGVIANASAYTKVSNVHLTGKITIQGYGYVGGIVGHGYVKIDNCSVIGDSGSTITAHYWCAGGILGYGGEGNGATTIRNCAVESVTVHGNYGGAAAICGLANSGAVGENLSASKVSVTSNSDYCMGYIFGNGEEGTLTNIKISNTTVTANGVIATPTDASISVGGVMYKTITEALAAAKAGETVTLLGDLTGAGFEINKSITIDFNGFTYTVTAPVAGGDGIVIKSGLNVTLKNGSITAASGSIYALIQNSAKLTVQDMNLRGLDTTKFVLSNNICKVQILGNTNIYAANVAFDVYAYCTVTLNTTGLISGNIQVSGKNASLTVENGNFTVAPKAEWLAEESILTEKANGTYLVKKAVGIVGANMTLGSSLNVNFYVNKADLKGIDFYAIITETAADGTVKTVKVPFAAWTAKGDLYKITFEGVAAKEMADAFTIQIFDSNTDVAVSKLHEDSVRDYAMRVLAKAETTAKEKTLIVDMLNYGAAAQKFFNYNAENLANALLSDEQKGFATAEVTAEDKRVKGEKYVGSMLKLENKVQLVLVFEGLTEDMVAMVTYEGQSEPMILDSSKFVYNNSNGQVAIVIDTLEPADASKVVTCMIVDGGEVISTVSDSIESYIARVNNGAGANELYDAILKFAASAAANQ